MIRCPFDQVYHCLLGGNSWNAHRLSIPKRPCRDCAGSCLNEGCEFSHCELARRGPLHTAPCPQMYRQWKESGVLDRCARTEKGRSCPFGHDPLRWREPECGGFGANYGGALHLDSRACYVACAQQMLLDNPACARFYPIDLADVLAFFVSRPESNILASELPVPRWGSTRRSAVRRLSAMGLIRLHFTHNSPARWVLNYPPEKAGLRLCESCSRPFCGDLCLGRLHYGGGVRRCVSCLPPRGHLMLRWFPVVLTDLIMGFVLWVPSYGRLE